MTEATELSPFLLACLKRDSEALDAVMSVVDGYAFDARDAGAHGFDPARAAVLEEVCSRLTEVCQSVGLVMGA